MLRPNILWILTTQWRAQATGYGGDPNARTPCLDAVARESINYTQAVTPHPFGPFARAAMLTGIPSPENGVCDYFDPLPTTALTIAHMLGQQGYATAFFGKWHLWKRAPGVPLVGDEHARIIVPPEARGGFGFWEGLESGFLLNDPWLHGTRLPEPVQFKGYQSDILCERAGSWFGEANQDARPWFCVVSLEAPHPPYDAPAAGIAPENPRGLVLSANVPRGGAVEMKARRELAGYYAHLEATDRAIGCLFSKAEPGKTLVVFTSVHGDMHGAHGLFRKGWPYEESVRVPLLVRLPQDWRLQSKDQSSEQVSLVDLPRMTLDWIEGRMPAIEDTGSRISMPSVVPLPHQCDRIWRGIRTAKQKLVLNQDGTPWLYFDLENDPLEMNNLVGNAERRREMDKLGNQLMPG